MSDLSSLNDIIELSILNCKKLTNNSIKHMTKLRKLHTSLSLKNCDFPELYELKLLGSDINNETLEHFNKLAVLDLCNCKNINIILNNLKKLILYKTNIHDIKNIDNLNDIKICSSKIYSDD